MYILASTEHTPGGTHVATATVLPADASPSSPQSEAEVDTALVSRVLAHDESAFATLVTRYRTRIHAASLAMLHNHADAEEITQDTFLRAYRGLARFRGDSTFATWLFRIATNLSRNRYWYFFRRRRQDTLSLNCPLSDENAGSFSELVADPAKNPSQSLAEAEFAVLVGKCIAQLDAPQREILQLRSTLNHSYAEIAGSLGINIGTVKSRIARAREHLRVLLVAACPEFDADASPQDWYIPSPSVYGRPRIANA